ncbi:MAG: type II secretion system F family protein [Simkania negevensis]|nr:type II secretion system F family protein [Simkania negevensis]
MPLYRYTALSAKGSKLSGFVTADTSEIAIERLQVQSIFVTKLSLYEKRSKEISFPSPLLIQFTNDLFILLRAGLPLYEALQTAQEKYRSHKVHPLLLDLCDQVKQGKHLSLAMANYPNTFSPVYLAMIKAGEESGKLEESFEELSKLLSRSELLKRKVSSALIYPLFLGVFTCVVIGFLLFFLIPSMKDLFAERQLHPFTQAVLNLSTFLNKHFLPLSLLFFSVVLFFFLFFRARRGKALLKKGALHLPILGPILVRMILNRFGRVFSTLLLGGVPMLDTLRLAKQVLYHPDFEKIISSAEEKVIEGKLLSQELQKSPLIPNLFIRMLSVGEEAGKVGKMMAHLAEIYDEEIERNLARLTSLLQPCVLLFLGVVVAIVLLSVLLPLTDVSSMLN